MGRIQPDGIFGGFAQVFWTRSIVHDPIVLGRAAGIVDRPGDNRQRVPRHLDFRALADPYMRGFWSRWTYHWTEGATCEPRAPAQSVDQSTDEKILAVIGSELLENIGDMEFCRAFSNVQLMGDLLVREMPEEKLEHLAFPCGQ